MKKASTLLNGTNWYQLSVEQTVKELEADSAGCMFIIIGLRKNPSGALSGVISYLPL